MKTRFTEEQIIKMLKEHEGGKRAVDIVRDITSQSKRFTAGRANTAVWMSAKPKG